MQRLYAPSCKRLALLIFLTVKVFKNCHFPLEYVVHQQPRECQFSLLCRATIHIMRTTVLKRELRPLLHGELWQAPEFVASSRPVTFILNTQGQKCKSGPKLKTVPPKSIREGNTICNREINYIKISSIINTVYFKTPLSVVHVLSKQCFIHWVMLVLSLGWFTV